MSNRPDLKAKHKQRLPVSRTGKTIAFLGMVIGTAGIGAVIAFLSAFISGLVMREWNIGFASLGILLLLMIIGYLAGVIVGMVLTDRVIHYRGSLLFAIPASIMGTGLVFVLAADPLNLNPNISVLFTCLFLFPPLMGTTGFHLGRKRNNQTSRTK